MESCRIYAKEIEMLFFKSCTKCSTGTVELRSGLDGYEMKCLNCGFENPVSSGFAVMESDRTVAA